MNKSYFDLLVLSAQDERQNFNFNMVIISNNAGTNYSKPEVFERVKIGP